MGVIRALAALVLMLMLLSLLGILIVTDTREAFAEETPAYVVVDEAIAPEPEAEAVLYAPPPTIPDRIAEAAVRWNVPVDWALRVAWCESRWGTHENTYNGKSGYYGIFQFSLRTWRSTPWGHLSPADDAANIEAAMWLYHHGGPRHWGCK